MEKYVVVETKFDSAYNTTAKVFYGEFPDAISALSFIMERYLITLLIGKVEIQNLNDAIFTIIARKDEEGNHFEAEVHKMIDRREA